MNYGNCLRPINYLAKHECVHLPQTDDCHAIIAAFGDDESSIRKIDKTKKMLWLNHWKPRPSVLSNTSYMIEKKTKRKNHKIPLQKSAFLTINDVIDKDGPV